MWHAISNKDELKQFMQQIRDFHDCCVKDICYSSGAYVNESLSMHPVNDSRILRMMIQRQFSDMPVLELEFYGLKYMKLHPIDEGHTCELQDASMIMTDEYIYWCDWGGLSEVDMARYDGTVICATGVRWREIKGHLGPAPIYGMV